MINVNQRGITGDKDTSELDMIRYGVINTKLFEKRREIEKCVDGLKCKDHPSSNSSILLIADPQSFNIRSTYNFCCDKFKDEVNKM